MLIHKNFTMLIDEEMNKKLAENDEKKVFEPRPMEKTETTKYFYIVMALNAADGCLHEWVRISENFGKPDTHKLDIALKKEDIESFKYKCIYSELRQNTNNKWWIVKIPCKVLSFFLCVL